MSNHYRGPAIDASYKFMFMIVCYIKKNQFFCGKRDNSNLNIYIYFSIIHLKWICINKCDRDTHPKPYIFMIRVTSQIKCIIAQAPGSYPTHYLEWTFLMVKLELSLFPQKNWFFFRKHTIINMNCLWRPCMLMDRDEMSNLYRGPSIDASYQVSIHLDQ
jgi:hypothetical protein